MGTNIVVCSNQLADGQRRHVEAAIELSLVTPRFCKTSTQLKSLLDDDTPPALVIVDSHNEDFSEAMDAIRSHLNAHWVTTVASVNELRTQPVLDAHDAAADGVIFDWSVPEIVSLARLYRSAPKPPRDPDRHGTVIVAHKDRDLRTRQARYFLRLGFGIRFAESVDEISADASIRAIAIHESALRTDAQLAQVKQLHAQFGGEAALVVASNDLSLRHAVAGLNLQRLDSAPGGASAAHMMFRMGELLRGDAVDGRQSERAMHRSIVSVRRPGEFDTLCALSHNISERGLYVQTAHVPADRGDVWIEMYPYRDEQLVHLRGSVVWTRPVLSERGGPMPGGYGVLIDPAQCPEDDYRRYLEGYVGLTRARMTDLKSLIK